MTKGRVSKVADVRCLVKSLCEYHLDDYSHMPDGLQEFQIVSVGRRLLSLNLEAVRDIRAFDVKKAFPDPDERRVARYLLTGSWSGPPLNEVLSVLDILSHDADLAAKVDKKWDENVSGTARSMTPKSLIWNFSPKFNFFFVKNEKSWFYIRSHGLPALLHLCQWGIVSAPLEHLSDICEVRTQRIFKKCSSSNVNQHSKFCKSIQQNTS